MSAELFKLGQKIKVIPNKNWSTAFHNQVFTIRDCINQHNYIIEDRLGYRYSGWFEPDGEGKHWIKVNKYKAYLPSWL